MTDEIALFIDFENIRYSLINVQRREPDPQELIALARRFGTVMVARAYADWSRQPEFFKGSLTAAMIDRVDCPAKVRERFRQTPQQSGFQPQSSYQMAQSDDDELDAPEYDAEDSGLDEEREQTVVRAEESAAIDLEGEGLSGHEGESGDERRGRFDTPMYGNSSGSYGNGGNFYHNPQPVITQSTVDLNMLMDIIETVFDRPNINTFILMSGDRDFTRICARLKLRLNKRVVVVGVPGTVSRDLISAAEQFIPLGYGSGPLHTNGYPTVAQPTQFVPVQGPVEPDEPGFIQFLDYIDRHWSWRTVGGVANFIGDPFNPKNRFRGRLTRESARDLLRICIDEGILSVMTDNTGSENLRLNRQHPAVEPVLMNEGVPR
ncbi:MAG TPA: NYN domain-containing protein [Ktedonobacterales bacterium]